MEINSDYPASFKKYVKVIFYEIEVIVFVFFILVIPLLFVNLHFIVSNPINNCKQIIIIPTWYGVTENDRIVPPEAQQMFAQQVNATVLSINSSHASPLSDPNEVAQLILNATKGSSK